MYFESKLYFLQDIELALNIRNEKAHHCLCLGSLDYWLAGPPSLRPTPLINQFQTQKLVVNWELLFLRINF
jgi:hypothetical protein